MSTIHVWFRENGMALNPTKSDTILFGTSQRLKTMSSLASVKLDDSVIQFSDTVKILGATLDSSLTMGPHTKATSKSCFYHIYAPLGKSVHLWITLAISVASALVSSRLDYANSVLFGCMYVFILQQDNTQNIKPEGQQGSEALTAARNKKCLEQILARTHRNMRLVFNAYSRHSLEL